MQPTTTFAEKLGWSRDARIVIFHIDDVGMCSDSNEGAKQALEYGITKSASIMLPCAHSREFPWAKYSDIGVHITMNAEWDHHRWGPISTANSASGLVDKQGMFWQTVEDFAQYANKQDVLTEVEAQIERAYLLGFSPSHIDSHMFALLSKQEFLNIYATVAIKYRLPALIPAGHCRDFGCLDLSESPGIQEIRAAGKELWDAGLPVVDDVYFDSYNWPVPTDRQKVFELAEHRISRYSGVLHSLEPGITVILTHCAAVSNSISAFSGSGVIRGADLLALTSEQLRKLISDEGIILSTWQELSERRKLMSDTTRRKSLS